MSGEGAVIDAGGEGIVVGLRGPAVRGQLNGARVVVTSRSSMMPSVTA
jgi:hypothetical protein